MTWLSGPVYLAAAGGGVILSAAASVPYIRDTLRGIRTPQATSGIAKPQVVSWAVWAGILVIGGTSSLTARQWPSAAYTLACAAECGLIALLGLRIPARYRDPPVQVPLPRGKTVRLDLICLAGGAAGLALLALARDPAAAVLAAVAADVLAYIPTMVHAWREPHEETLLTYAGFAAGAALSLAAVAVRQPGSMLVVTAVGYPAYLLVADSSAAAVIGVRRRGRPVPAAAGPAAGEPEPGPGRRRPVREEVRLMRMEHDGPGPQQPVTLLESLSPYGSRKVTVEYDGQVTAAYLHDAAAAVSAVWIANHGTAPPAPERARLDAGRAPLMPAAWTRHPGGRPPLQPGTLDALWFEEGDGVAITECGRPVAVLAGWSDAGRGMPGYSSEVTSQTPFGWPLEQAMEALAPRLERARSYWRWRGSDGGWNRFEQGLHDHLSARLGPGGRYWDATGGQQPLTGVTERPPAPGRPYTVLSTVGMSCQRMPLVEQVLEDPSGYARIELAVATTLPAAQAARIFSWLALYPWQAVTWFGPGHSVSWYDEPAAFPLGDGAAVLLLDSPGVLGGPEPPDLSGFSFGGDPVRWLWVVPISERDRRLAKEYGSDHLISLLAAGRRGWIAGPGPGSPVPQPAASGVVVG